MNRLPQAKGLKPLLENGAFYTQVLLAKALKNELNISDDVAANYVDQLLETGLFRKLEKKPAYFPLLNGIYSWMRLRHTLKLENELELLELVAKGYSKVSGLQIEAHQVVCDDYLSDTVQLVSDKRLRFIEPTLNNLVVAACAIDKLNRQKAWSRIADIVGTARRPLLEVFYEYEDVMPDCDLPRFFAGLSAKLVDGVLHVNSKDLKVNTLDINDMFHAHSAMLLICDGMSYLNHLTNGYGRMWTRYLKEFSEMIYSAQVNWCILHDPEQELVQIIDRYPHNVLLDNTLLQNTIDYTGNTAGLNQIEVYLKDGRPTLYHTAWNKDIYPVDIEVLSPDVRGTMYKFLMLFGKLEPRLSLLRRVLWQELSQHAVQNVLPRVVVDNTFIISRKRFAGSIPQHVVTRLQLRTFIESLQFGSHVYVTTGGYKPQFYAIEQHVHIDRLWRDLRQSLPGEVVIEEAYPKYAADEFASEWVIQW